MKNIFKMKTKHISALTQEQKNFINSEKPIVRKADCDKYFMPDEIGQYEKVLVDTCRRETDSGLTEQDVSSILYPGAH